VLHDAPDLARDLTSHSRAYLALAKAGDVRQKMSVYETKHEGGGPLKSLPNIDIDFMRNRVTDTSRVVRKAQEMPDVNHIKNRLLSNSKEKDLFDYCGALLSKSKLKHFCKRVGHSRILGKMVSLQKSSHTKDDAGFRSLNTRAEAETEYISRYRSGEVESKKHVFEPRGGGGVGLVDPMEEDVDPEFPPPSFSWSLRFDRDLPVRADAYSVAQKHNQYRHYYGYRPGEDRPALHSTYLGPPGSRRPIYQAAGPPAQPASLPATLGPHLAASLGPHLAPLPAPPPRHPPNLRQPCLTRLTRQGPDTAPGTGTGTRSAGGMHSASLYIYCI
jgi:hypothetical protein